MAGKISINYRRGDDPGYTQALYQMLEQEFPSSDLGMDVESQIKPGDDFVAVLSRRVAAFDVFLVVIGPRWADLLARHTGVDNDFVAIEIKAALDQGKRVIPVLVGGAAMPQAALLPQPLRALARRHAVALRPERFKADCQGLVTALKEQLAATEQEPRRRSLSERLAAEVEPQRRETGGTIPNAASDDRSQPIAHPSTEAREAEELVNWRAIKEGRDVEALRDHLTRFPEGATAQFAIDRLEELVWVGLGPSPALETLKRFLDEFPRGRHSPAARAQLAILVLTRADVGDLVTPREMPRWRPFRARIDPAAATWRYYADTLSVLLLVLIFLLSVFIVAQSYVSHESTAKDTVLRRLQRQTGELINLVAHEKHLGKSLNDELRALQATLAKLKSDNERLARLAQLGGEKDTVIAALGGELAGKISLSSEAQARVDLLNKQVATLTQQIATLQEISARHEAKDKENQARIADLGSRLNVLLARQIQELQRYRSDFFGRLRQLLRDRREIRVVGDRFVFESEVLFASGQASLTAEGLAAIDQLAIAILELDRVIPREVDWMLQVNGHTDLKPIASTLFPSSWELSGARAVTVVKTLILKGVPPKRLAAAGHGEFQPLEEGSKDVLRRNRRIELKLVNR
jgi:chemotaxis protein MotB